MIQKQTFVLCSVLGLLGCSIPLRAEELLRPEIRADGQITRVDLDGDGKRERIALARCPAKDGFSRFLLTINGVKWRKNWRLSNSSEEITGCKFAPLRRGSHQLFIFVMSESSFEGGGTTNRIYQWKRGRLQGISPLLESVGRIDGDGSLIENTGYQWISIPYRWKLNRNGILQRVKRKIYPVYSSGMNSDRGQGKISIHLGKFARFYRAPNWKSSTVMLPADAAIVFTGITYNNWLRAQANNQVFWINLNVVDQSFQAFPFPRAG